MIVYGIVVTKFIFINRGINTMLLNLIRKFKFKLIEPTGYRIIEESYSKHDGSLEISYRPQRRLFRIWFNYSKPVGEGYETLSFKRLEDAKRHNIWHERSIRSELLYINTLNKSVVNQKETKEN